LRVPRTDNLFNRKRQLICVTELADAGLRVAPHLSAAQPGDWRFWQSYLKRNATVGLIAAEFQTGNKNPVEGGAVIGRLAAIQDAVARPIHPLIIGGTQFTRNLVANFDSFTLIDSCPFMKAVKRQRFDAAPTGRSWTDTYTLREQGVEDIFMRNLEGHV